MRNHVSFQGKDVLEVGCGNGRVTAKYWDEPRTLVAIDPDKDALEDAKAQLPSKLSGRVSFGVGECERLHFPAQSFDVAFFTWSLCCVQNTKKSMREAWRVLRPGGMLVNVMPDAVPTFEKAMVRALGGKEAARQGSADAFGALVNATREGLFLQFREERIFFDVYFDSIGDLMTWLPSKAGPFDQDEFDSISKKSLAAIKGFCETLKHGQNLRLRDTLIISSATKRQ